MQYNPPYGSTGANPPGDPYINGDPSVGRAGSIPPAASIEFPQREIVNLINNVGITPDNADLNQLARSIQTGRILYALDSGTATAYAINLTPAPLQYWDGMFLWIIPANANSGPATINVNGLGALNIVRRGGGPLQAGDMPANYKSLLTYNSIHNNFELYGVAFSAQTGFMPVLLANTTWYVNASTGSDTLYDGTSATISGPHGPFKTINKAVSAIYVYGPSVYTATVQIAAGTYPEGMYSPMIPGPHCIFRGAGINSTFVAPPANNNGFWVGGPNVWEVHDLCINTTSGVGPPVAFAAYSGATMNTYNTASAGYTNGGIWEGYQAICNILGNHNFKAGSNVSVYMSGGMGGICNLAGAITLTFEGTANGSYFAAAQVNGIITVNTYPSNPYFANAGYAVMYKFYAGANGVIYTQGLGQNFLPGSSPGQFGPGGIYL